MRRRGGRAKAQVLCVDNARNDVGVDGRTKGRIGELLSDISAGTSDVEGSVLDAHWSRSNAYPLPASPPSSPLRWRPRQHQIDRPHGRPQAATHKAALGRPRRPGPRPQARAWRWLCHGGGKRAERALPCTPPLPLTRWPWWGHVATHELGAAAYAIKVVRAAAPAGQGNSAGRLAECRWQRQRPSEVVSGLAAKTTSGCGTRSAGRSSTVDECDVICRPCAAAHAFIGPLGA